MRKLIAALLALLLTNCVSTSHSYNTLSSAAPPPARFDHPYKGEMVIVWADSDRVHQGCSSSRAAGCVTYRTKDKCHILADQAYRGQEWLIQHERGHCNGWSRWHEN